MSGLTQHPKVSWLRQRRAAPSPLLSPDSLPSLGTAPDDEDAAAEAGRWVDRVWGRRDGRALVCFGHDGHVPPGGGYRFSNFEQRSYTWPEEREELLREALHAARDADVYVGCALHELGSTGRRKATVLPASVAWADVDGEWTEQRQQALSRLGVSVWQVASGARGGRHVYVPLDAQIDREQLEALNRRLSALLGGDDGWSADKVLRLPGTWNHKPRAVGQPSVPVRWCP